jgi:hypothetical protein
MLADTAAGVLAEPRGGQADFDAAPPRVSVVMPVHNGMPYLPLAIDSILAQSFDDFEFIIIDDASTDATAEVLADYAHRDRRIRILTNARNLGISGAINVGLEAARGELVARMDADDIALPDRFGRQVAFLDAHPDHVVVGTSCSFIDAAGRVTNRDFNRRAIEDWELQWIAHFWAPLVHPTAMFRGAAVRQRGLRFDSRFLGAQDMDFFARMLNAGKGFVLREPLLRYRRHGGNVTSVLFAEQKHESCDIALHHLLARYPELQPHAEPVTSLVGMLHRQGLAAGRTLAPVVDTMLLIEQRFLRRQHLSRRQRRRIQSLTACWIIWGALQAGRLRPSAELLGLLWQGRVHWAQFCREAVSFGGMLFAADCVKRFLAARFRA